MRWGRIVAGGFLAELALIVVAVPALAFGNQTILNWTAVIGSALTSYLGALWVARRLESRIVLHGALVGVTAMVIYLAILAASGQIQSQPAIYWLAHLCKILGGTAGGLFAARRVASVSGIVRANV